MRPEKTSVTITTSIWIIPLQASETQTHYSVLLVKKACLFPEVHIIMQNILLLIILVNYKMMGFIVLCILLSLFLRLLMLYLPVVCPSDIAEQHSIL